MDNLMARILGSRLDARLVAGAAPECGRLLAARAAHLVAPTTRARLADAWEEVLARASEPAPFPDPRLPVARVSVRAAAAQINALAALLRSATPLAAGDVARARALLTDGAGPVYFERRGLASAVATIVAAAR